MSNYNLTLQSNNTDLQAILNTINELPEAGGTQATPVISVNSTNGLITATAGTKSSTHQLAFQPAKTITPGTASQIAVSSGYYTGGNITVAAVPTQTKSVTPKATSQNVTPDSGKFLSKVTVTGDANLVAGNIKSGVSIFGVSGTLQEGSGSSSGELVDYSENEDAMVTRTLSSYFNDRVTSIGSAAFCNCSRLTTVSFPNVTTIGSAAFEYCSSLTTVSFPKVTTIYRYAFQQCSRLTTVSFPNVTTIDSAAFSGCLNLTTVSFPKVTTISDSAFCNCSSLTTVSFPKVTTISDSAFCNCSRLTTVSFPKVTSIGSAAFEYCSSLTTVSFPKVTSIYRYTFTHCSRLTTVSFPNVTTIDSAAFEYCSSLTTVSFPKVTTISNYAFQHCYNLKALYLTGTSLCELLHSKVFTFTPIDNYTGARIGSIYVPASLLTSYQTATNWAYFSSRFVGI